MRRTKKVSCIILALALMLGLAVSASAEVTVTQPQSIYSASTTNLASGKTAEFWIDVDGESKSTYVYESKTATCLTNGTLAEEGIRLATMTEISSTDAVAYVIIDFATPTTFNQLFLGDWRNGAFKEYTVSVSDNKEDWTPVKSGTSKWDSNSRLAASWSNTFHTSSISIPTVTARYLKIEMSKPVGWVNNALAGSLNEVRVYNTPYWCSSENYANVNFYSSNVVATTAQQKNPSTAWNKQGLLAAVKPGLDTGYMGYTRGACAWLQGATYMVVDLGAERTIDTLQFLPYYENVDGFTLYSATADQYTAIVDAMSTTKALTADQKASLTQLYTASGTGNPACANTTDSRPNGSLTAGKLELDRNFVLGGSFTETTARYLVLNIDKMVGSDTETKAVCYIRSFEVYDWDYTEESEAAATTANGTVNIAATVANNKPVNGWQNEPFGVIAAEYVTVDGLKQLAKTTVLGGGAFSSGVASTVTGTYTPENQDAEVKVFFWLRDSLVPLTTPAVAQ